MRGSERQRQALDAVITAGSNKGAAHALGISERALNDRLRALRISNGATTTCQLAYRRGMEAALSVRMDWGVMPAWPDITHHDTRDEAIAVRVGGRIQ